MPIKLNSTNGSVTLNPEDGVGNVDLTVLRGGFTTFSSAAENIAGTVENKAVDPLGIREAFNCTGSAPVYACRAWVNFNGTGTVAIRASGNVSSITDNGAGLYAVNFATAMPDADYVVTSIPCSEGSDDIYRFNGDLVHWNATSNTSVSPTVSSFFISTCYLNTGFGTTETDKTRIALAIFR